MAQKEGLEKYLDSENRVTAWPNTAEGKQLVSEYLASLFETGVTYTERDITLKISQYHTFMNPTMLRRELIARKLMQRKPDCTAYWKE
ncbi:MAG: DUF2087 domain-containing protein [Treponemataceae bacterium]|nr:DUF2087 domain-containing protein [Treponemataceae bacterium]